MTVPASRPPARRAAASLVIPTAAILVLGIPEAAANTNVDSNLKVLASFMLHAHDRIQMVLYIIAVIALFGCGLGMMFRSAGISRFLNITATLAVASIMGAIFNWILFGPGSTTTLASAVESSTLAPGFDTLPGTSRQPHVLDGSGNQPMLDDPEGPRLLPDSGQFTLDALAANRPLADALAGDACAPSGEDLVARLRTNPDLFPIRLFRDGISQSIVQVSAVDCTGNDPTRRIKYYDLDARPCTRNPLQTPTADATFTCHRPRT